MDVKTGCCGGGRGGGDGGGDVVKRWVLLAIDVGWREEERAMAEGGRR